MHPYMRYNMLKSHDMVFVFLIHGTKQKYVIVHCAALHCEVLVFVFFLMMQRSTYV